MACLRIVVRGRVQGVGFRNYTYLAARSMGICGEVWNRADGGVEVLAEHPDQAVIEAFVEVVERGPGHVRDVQVEPTPARGYQEFQVGVTR